MSVISRFAPSPTGLLHLGHAYSALCARDAAQAAGGRFLLRLEDIDRTRCLPEFEAAAYEDLAWLGLEWETPVRRQSDHFDDYGALLDRLGDRGLVYPCFCTRKQISEEVARSSSAPHGPDGIVYPGTCRHLTEDERLMRIEAGEDYALRLDMEKALASVAGRPLAWTDEAAGEVACDPRPFGDVVLARKDTPASYHLAVAFDDALQGVSLVVRGQDLFHATHIHRLLQAVLDLPTPRYRHHRLLTDETGRRLAKRDKALTLRALREAGHGPLDIRKMAGLA